jgi:hypothetical protein
MKIDNRKNTYQIWLGRFLSTTILTVLVIVIWFTDFFKTPVLGLDKSWYFIALVIAYSGLSIYNILRKPHYVYFSDNGDKIILRYYPTRIFNRSKSSIEIPKQSFFSWEVKTFLFGSCEMLYVYGKMKTRVAKYPGISLSAVSKNDRDKIKAALTNYVKKNSR